MNCQHCQSLLLDHLYGLLEGPEVAALDAHLASCPACAVARAETARVQGLIARAAKSAFPATKFEPPALPQSEPTKSDTRTPTPGTPTVLPLFTPSEHKRRGTLPQLAAILPWAIAVAVLIAIPSTVIPVLGIFDRVDRTSHDAQTAQREADTAANAVATAQARIAKNLTDAQFKFTVAEQTQTALLHKWLDEQKKAARDATTRKFTIDVLKPATVQPGAPNDFVVVVNDRRPLWETTGKRMIAEIHAVDTADAVIFTQPLNNERTADKRHPLRLPASAWAKMKPGAELFLVVAQVDEKTQTRTELQDRIRLAGPVFTTLLVTDKATYRPGERLFFRSLTLDRVTFQPPTREQILKYELLHPDGRTVNGLSVTGTTDLVRVDLTGDVQPVRMLDNQPVRGVGCGEFVLPTDLPDGDYRLRLTEGQHPGGFAPTVPLPVTRVVKVRAGVVDNYRKEIGFARESFAPGDTVEAWAELKFQNKPVSNAVVAAVAVVVDGEPMDAEIAKQTDAAGRVRIRFPLPSEVLKGDVRLKVTFRTPHGEEVVAKRVPVIGNRVVIEFFPESGNTLVAGVPCKVYVRATTPAGQPVHFRGVITDGKQTLAKVESFNDRSQPGTNRGLASFTYTPRLGTRVWLKLESPSTVYAPIMAAVPVPSAAVALLGGPGAVGTRTGFPLPLPQADGVVMSVLDPITAPGEAIRVQLYSVGQPRTLVLGAYTRGKLSDTQKILVEPELPQIVKLMAGNDPRGGVVRITAFEEFDEMQDLHPVAERLVFRKPGEVLKLAFTASNAKGAVPSTQPVPLAMNLAGFGAGSAVELSITATDEKGTPAAAILWAAVVNSGVAPGTRDRLLPTHFLLAGEVKNPDDLEYADFLLTDHPNAGEALDLVLGTQGWRRFVEQSTFQAVPGKQSNKVLFNPELAQLMIQNGQYQVWTEHAPIRDHRELYQKYSPAYEAAVKAVAQAKANLEATNLETRDTKAILEATSAAEDARRTATEKNAKAEAARNSVQRFRANVWYGIAGLAALAFCCGLASFLRPTGRLPMSFSTLGSIGLAAFLIAAAGWGEDAQAGEKTPRAMTQADKRDSRADGREQFGEPTDPAANATASKVERQNDALGSLPAKSGAAADKVEGSEPTVTGGMSVGKPQAGKSGPPFAAQPVILPGMGYGMGGQPGGGVGGFGGSGGNLSPMPVAPTAMTVPPPPIFVGPLPGSMPPSPAGPGGPGWDPKHSNGVTFSELAASQNAAAGMLRKRAGTTQHAEELKKATDRAAAVTKERGKALTGPLDMVMGRAKSKVAAAAAMPPSPEAAAWGLVRGSVSPVTPLVVREFAATRPVSAPFPDSTDAEDTPDTVLWQPVIVLPADGKVTFPFQLGDAPGGYEVLIAGHTTNGRLGATRGLILLSPSRTVTPIVPAGSVPPVVPLAPGPQPMP